MTEDRSDLSVAIGIGPEQASPGALVQPGHPVGCTCGRDADIQIVLFGGMTLRSLLDLCDNTAKALREQTVEDPETGELIANTVS